MLKWEDRLGLKLLCRNCVFHAALCMPACGDSMSLLNTVLVPWTALPVCMYADQLQQCTYVVKLVVSWVSLESKTMAAVIYTCCAVLCYAMLCYAMLCYAMLCYAMLCYAMLCYAMLCYAMLCCAVLYCWPGSSWEVGSWCAGTEGCTMQPSRTGQSHMPGSSSCTSYTLLSASGAQYPLPCLEPTTGPIPVS